MGGIRLFPEQIAQVADRRVSSLRFRSQTIGLIEAGALLGWRYRHVFPCKCPVITDAAEVAGRLSAAFQQISAEPFAR